MFQTPQSMKKFLAFACLVALAVTTHLKGTPPDIATSETRDFQALLYKRLCDINHNWSNYTPNFDLIHQSDLPDDDVELIQTHLRLVLHQLEKADVNHLTSNQLEQRMDSIQRLRTYTIEGKFPQNIYVPGRRAVFIDPWGTHCAVGHLIASSGHADLAMAINRDYQLADIVDIKTKGLSEWQTTSGLSPDELALIQPHYEFRARSTKLSYPKEIEDLILGDSSTILEALKSENWPINARCGGKTLLHFAAAAGDLELVKTLVEMGADLYAVSELGCDEAHIASAGNHKMFTVRWNESTLVTPTKAVASFAPIGRVFETDSGTYTADVLQDLWGGVSGKNALYFATEEPRPTGLRPRPYRFHLANQKNWLPNGKTKGEENVIDKLNRNREAVANWLEEQGLE